MPVYNDFKHLFMYISIQLIYNDADTSGTGLEMYIYENIYICIGYMLQTVWGVYVDIGFIMPTLGG